MTRPKGVGSRRNARTADGLTTKQQALREGLLKGKSAREAAAAAGITPKHASTLMRDELFQAALRDGQLKLAEAGLCTRIDLMRELWNIGKADLRKLMNDDGTLLDPVDWPADVSGAIQSIDVQETFEGEGKNRVWTGQLKKIRLHPKIDAIKQLALMIGANAPPKAAVGPDGKPVGEVRRILVVPMKRDVADMDGYGTTYAVIEAEKVVPPADDAPPMLATPAQALAKLRKLGKSKVAK